MNDFAPSLFFGILIGLAVMWGACRWYYTKNGRAKLIEDKAALAETVAEALSSEQIEALLKNGSDGFSTMVGRAAAALGKL